MSYHIYTTKGLVLRSVAVEEADRLYSILTRDLGLVRASGRAVRREISKLRGALEPYTFVELALVRGKSSWRITSAQALSTLKHLDREAFLAFARILDLVEKLVAGEVAEAAIYDLLESAAEDAVRLEAADLELETLVKILFELGYVAEKVMPPSRREKIALINHGIRSSNMI